MGKCNKPALARVYWPGSEPSPMCSEHCADAERIAEAMGLLGGVLTGQERFAEAEPLLVESWETLQHKPGLKESRRAAFLKRVIALYEAWQMTRRPKILIRGPLRIGPAG